MWPFKPKTGHEAIGGAQPRSPKWAAVRRKHLKEHPFCEACGNNTNLNCHHKAPYHLFPDLELVEENLITLCEDGPGKASCHFLFGHLGLTWSDWNPQVAEDSAQFAKRRADAIDRRDPDNESHTQ